MDGGARRVSAQVALVGCVLALVATSPGSNDIGASARFDVALPAEEPTTEFDVELELTPAALEQPFLRPLTIKAKVISTIVPQPHPTVGDAELPTVTASVRPYSGDGAPLEGSEREEAGTAAVRTADCLANDPCIRRFRVEISRQGGGSLPILAEVSLSADAAYEDRPDHADVELRHPFDVEAGPTDESVTRRTALGPGPHALMQSPGQSIGAADGRVLTFTRTEATADATIPIIVPNPEPDRSTPGALHLVPFDEGPRLVIPIGFTSDVDPFVSCTATAPCMREYTIRALSVPPLGRRPTLRLDVPDGVIVDIGPSTLRVADVVAEGHETGTVTIEGGADARIERMVEVAVDHGGRDPEGLAPPTTARMWVLLEAEASGLEAGSVTARLVIPSSDSPGGPARVLDPDRPAASVARVLVNELRSLDTQGPHVTVLLQRRGGGDGPVEVRWMLRGVVSGTSSNLPPGSTVRFPPAEGG